MLRLLLLLLLLEPWVLLAAALLWRPSVVVVVWVVVALLHLTLLHLVSTVFPSVRFLGLEHLCLWPCGPSLGSRTCNRQSVQPSYLPGSCRTRRWARRHRCHHCW